MSPSFPLGWAPSACFFLTSALLAFTENSTFPPNLSWQHHANFYDRRMGDFWHPEFCCICISGLCNRATCTHDSLYPLTAEQQYSSNRVYEVRIFRGSTAVEFYSFKKSPHSPVFCKYAFSCFSQSKTSKLHPGLTSGPCKRGITSFGLERYWVQ